MPVVPAPLLAGPLLSGLSGKTGKKPNRPGDDAKGKFRETMWFKKGELDARAAQAAAEEHARTGKITSDKSDHLPLDERYKDDGSLSRTDKDLYSLRTGATLPTQALHDPARDTAAGHKVSENELIGEMKRGRNTVIALVAVGLVVAAIIVFLLAR
jgi:hypothetical protein